MNEAVKRDANTTLVLPVDAVIQIILNTQNLCTTLLLRLVVEYGLSIAEFIDSKLEDIVLRLFMAQILRQLYYHHGHGAKPEDPLNHSDITHTVHKLIGSRYAPTLDSSSYRNQCQLPPYVML